MVVGGGGWSYFAAQCDNLVGFVYMYGAMRLSVCFGFYGDRSGGRFPCSEGC